MPGGSQTTTSSSKPWKPAEPYIKEIMSEGSDIYGRGTTFVDPNQYQTQGLEQIAGMAQQGSPLTQQAPGALSDIIQSGGMNQQQQQVASSLMPYATGQNLSQGNPHLDNIIKQNTQDITESVKSTSQGLGRTGGNAYHTGELTRGIGEMMNNLRAGDYNQQVQNQMGAAGQVLGANAQGQQQALQGASLAPTINEFRYSDPSKLASVGGALRGFDQEQIDAPWSDLSKYASIINPTGGGGSGFGMQSQTQSSSADPLSTALGVGLQLLPMMVSDERLKEDIEPVGETFGGIPIYKYAYKGDPTGRKQMGVMAQDMLEKNPAAVGNIGGGFMGVDYSQVR